MPGRPRPAVWTGCAAAALALAAAAALPARAQIPAFPGAEGFGASTPGGRGGAVVEVTNLNDAGPGSLRDALQVRTGARTVVFRVSGTIALASRIEMKAANSFVTVAGQTAPGEGIQLKNYGLMLRDGVHDVVVRHLRIRPGDTTPGDWNKDGVLVYGYGGTPVYNVVFDHVSVEWAIDENVDVWDWVQSVTFQWCVIAEGSMTGHAEGPHSMGMLAGAHPKINLSVHHCLFAHNAARNPRLGDNREGVGDVRNNVIYNWRNFGPAENYGGAPVNYVGNVFLAGPNSSTVERSVFTVPDRTNSTGVRLYVDGNRGPLCPEGCADDWDLRVVFAEDNQVYPADEALNRIYDPLPAPPVTTWPAAAVVDAVLDGAGATLPRRDAVDARIVAEVRARTGQVGIGSDYPVLRAVAPPPDSDHDGMPDAWEAAHGLDPIDADDRNGDLNGDGYTNLEEYLNQRDPRAPPPAPGGGTVPDGASVPGPQLTVQRAEGKRIALAWGASCRAGDGDYAVYEGLLGDFDSHLPHRCSTGGATALTYRPREGSLYILVLPRDARHEGSYGTASGGGERPASAAPCLPQQALACP